ncbi:hypothetical protein GCM10023085_39170 [Actinomadura viridis]|uniref:Uncharacterized protein n=1 Tax=Actinomadura viridis TaxID=58110 RepID=A0A931DU90_9ACTN|nr:hypothetical protein [Actinomadura viridis]MBG6092798.1 hypothetical protein [Actinomadura viridis]
MQRVALLAADIGPDLREQLASGFTLTSVVMQLHPWPIRLIVRSLIIGNTFTSAAAAARPHVWHGLTTFKVLTR